MSERESDRIGGVGRRTVAKAIAWSVPAIALAVPAPALAASGGALMITRMANFCKESSSSSKVFASFELRNSGAAPLEVRELATISSPQVSLSLTAVTWGSAVSGLPFTVPGGADIVITVRADAQGIQTGHYFSVKLDLGWGEPGSLDPIQVASFQSPRVRFVGQQNCAYSG